MRAIASHEITHLQKKHPLKLALALMVAIFSPSIVHWLEDFAPRVVLSFVHSPEHLAAVYKVILAVHSVQQWALHDLFVAMLGFAGLYLLARRFEFQADAGAVQLTRDPEAKITALLKVSHLNLMPVRWGKGSSVWMTHPNTLRRLERIGRIGGMPPARVHELSESCTPGSLTSEDHYDLPPMTNQVALSNPRLRAHLWLKSLLTVRR